MNYCNKPVPTGETDKNGKEEYELCGRELKERTHGPYPGIVTYQVFDNGTHIRSHKNVSDSWYFVAHSDIDPNNVTVKRHVSKPATAYVERVCLIHGIVEKVM